MVHSAINNLRKVLTTVKDMDFFVYIGKVTTFTAIGVTAVALFTPVSLGYGLAVIGNMVGTAIGVKIGLKIVPPAKPE